MSTIARPSQASVAMTRCRSVCANDHSPGYRNIDRASWHRRDPLEGGRPRPVERGPGRAQPIRMYGAGRAQPRQRRLSSASTRGIRAMPLTLEKLSP
jgi:hypothetical protein